MASTLVVVPCSRRKIWDQQPGMGSVSACDAYTSPVFRINREYAERFGDCWMILSAKYGFIAPDRIIPGPYDVTFNDRRTLPATVDTLQGQVLSLGLGSFHTVITLGGKVYQEVIKAAFLPTSANVVAPFAGLPIGKYMQTVKRATASEKLLLSPSDTDAEQLRR